MDSVFTISPERIAPRLWLERLVIFRSLEPVDIIREMTFQRGLNIVWGVSQDADDESETPGVLTGHSVGKTTLCRLIRYALGEETFGRKSAQNAIRHAFPDGAIGATLHLEGVQWSILRSIGISGESYAVQETTIEALIHRPPGDQSYFKLQKQLQQAFIGPLPAAKPPNADQEYLWMHLLAWLSRDQESRYQNLWEWRSGRSESKVPAFKERKKAGLYLMRMVMDIMADDEVAITADLNQWNETLRHLEAQLREMQKEPEYQIRHHEQMLRKIVDVSPDDDTQGLFGLRAQVTQLDDSLLSTIGQLQNRRRDTADALSRHRAELLEYEKVIQKIEAALATMEEGMESTDDIDKELQKLETVVEGRCLYGQIPFKQCSYFNTYLKELRGELIVLQRARQDRAMDKAGDERKRIIQKWLEEKMQIREKLETARQTITALEQKERELEREIIALSAHQDRLRYHREQWEMAQDLRDGKRVNTEIERDKKEIETLKQKIRDGESNVKSMQVRQFQRGENLRRLYDKVLKTVLSESYFGDVRLPPRHDLEFRIREITAGLAGEAVETLSLVLADFTAVLWAVQGNGTHPAFLLHDSPREADLDRHIYGLFLKSVHTISDTMGGLNAPFQYIITTTSKPPKAILESQVVRLKLRAHPETDLLFKQFLIVGSPLA